jgi:hypothetical protein
VYSTADQRRASLTIEVMTPFSQNINALITGYST